MKILRYDIDSGIPEEVATRDFNQRRLLDLDDDQSGIYATCPMAVAGDGRIAIGARGPNYQITVVHPDSSHHLTWTGGAPPIPYTEEENDIVREAFANTDASPPPGFLESLDYKETIDRLGFDERGRLWVQRSPTKDGVMPDVFSTDGEYVGSIHHDRPSIFYGVHGDQVLLARRDNNDLWEAVLLTISWADKGRWRHPEHGTTDCLRIASGWSRKLGVRA